MRVWPRGGPSCLSARKAPTCIYLCLEGAGAFYRHVDPGDPAAFAAALERLADCGGMAPSDSPGSFGTVSATDRARRYWSESDIWVRWWGSFSRRALVLSLLGCAPDAELAARAGGGAGRHRRRRLPARSGQSAAGECENVRLADRASEIAYAACLDYNRRDLRACGRLRQAYEDDIRAQLATQKPAIARRPPLS